MNTVTKNPAAPTTALPYEVQLDREPRWALNQGSKYFEERSAVQQALLKIVRRLEELYIAYEVVGGLALFRHGFRRFTEVVDILVTAEGLRTIHQELEGLGYLPPFAGSKHLRDTELGVRIEFLVAGQFPSDGQPKPVAFPDPRQVAQDFDGIKYINLPTLIELKLASGMTSPRRLKDLADVQELIKLLNLPADFAHRLSPYVRAEFTELWQDLHAASQRFYRILELPAGMTPVATIDDLITMLSDAAPTLSAMKSDGVTVDRGRTTRERAYVMTDNADVARKYDMHEESEFLTE